MNRTPARDSMHRSGARRPPVAGAREADPGGSFIGLLRRDPALRARILIVAILAGMVQGQFVGQLFIWAAASRPRPLPFGAGSPQLLLATLVGSLLAAAMVWAARIDLRTTPLDMTLPISSRRIWTARTVSVLAVALPVTLAVTAASMELVGRFSGTPMLAQSAPRLYLVRLATAAVARRAR